MRYMPFIGKEPKPKNEMEELNRTMHETYDIPRNPVSDTTQFIISSTTIDVQKLEDKRFKENNDLEILSIDKFSALANIDERDQAHSALIWQDMKFAKTFGFKERYETKALEIIRLYNESRGRKGPGQFQDALITTKEVLISRHHEDEQEQKRKGVFGFMRKKEPQQQDEQNTGRKGEQQI